MLTHFKGNQSFKVIFIFLHITELYAPSNITQLHTHTTFCFHGRKWPVVVTTTVLAFLYSQYSEVKCLLTQLLVLICMFFLFYRYILLYIAISWGFVCYQLI